MINLNVIDLDNTLIPYDTLKRYVLIKIKEGDIYLLLFSIIRKLRIINKSNYSKKIYKSFTSCDRIKMDIFIQKQIININYRVLSLVKDHSSAYGKTINVLCSASPAIYVSLIADYIGYIGIGSDYYNSEYIHMYGYQKIKTIKERFPEDQYNYAFAISDSISDMPLLLCFNKHILLKR